MPDRAAAFGSGLQAFAYELPQNFGPWVITQADVVIDFVVGGFACAVEGGGDGGCFEGVGQPLGLGVVIGVTSDIHDEKWWDIFAFGHMVDGGIVFVFLGVVAELDPVAEGGHWQAMDTGAGFGHFDDGWHIVGIAIDWDTAFEDGEGQTFGLEVAVVCADDGG